MRSRGRLYKEIYLRTQQATPSLDRSSVYRTLKLFVELGLVVAGVNSEGEDVYEIPQAQPHHHLVCRRCGGEDEIAHDLVEGCTRRFRNATAFRRPVITWCCLASVLDAQLATRSVKHGQSRRQPAAATCNDGC